MSADGRVARLASSADGRPLVTPNDLAFGADGRLFVTDPTGSFGRGTGHVGARIVAFGVDDGHVETIVETGPHYPNGLAFLAAGRLCWVETYTRRVRVLDADNVPRTLAVLPEGHLPDGMAVAADGRIFIASVTSHGITVLSSEGGIVDVIPLDHRASPTNLCFDDTALWVTDFGHGFRPGRGDGRLWQIDTDATGLRLHTGEPDLRE